MRLTDNQLSSFDQDGLLILPDLFSAQEVALLRREMARLFQEDCESNVLEKDSRVVRTAMGLHERSDLFNRLSHHPRFVEPALQLLGEACYIQQTKINVKQAHRGEVWQWHYDFATHHHEDGVPLPRALNLHLFLDDVDESNGPLQFIAGSHKFDAQPAFLDLETTSYPLWVVDQEALARVKKGNRTIVATGAAGTGLIFGDLMVHGSPVNTSPRDRAIYSLILNPISNAYRKTDRPPYKHHRDLTLVTPLSDDCLLPQ